MGLRNYAKVFSNSTGYMGYITNTLLFTAVTTAMKTILGILLALMFTGKSLKINNVHRMIVFSPQVMSYMIVGLVFRSLMNIYFEEPKWICEYCA